MTEATLVGMRHAETVYNVLSLMSGPLEVSLTANGEKKAGRAGALISHIRFDTVFCSDKIRARNTTVLALAFAKTQDHLLDKENRIWRIKQREALTDFNTGAFTGLNYKTNIQVLDFDRNRGYDTCVPGGESEKQVVDRVESFFNLEVIPLLKEGKNVLCVTHSDTLNVFDIALGIAEIPKKGKLATGNIVPNATPVIYKYNNGVITKTSFVETPKDINTIRQNGRLGGMVF